MDYNEIRCDHENIDDEGEQKLHFRYLDKTMDSNGWFWSILSY